MSLKESFNTTILRRQRLLLRLARYEFWVENNCRKDIRLNWVNPLIPKSMDSKKMDVIHLTSTVPATDNRLGQKQPGHLCWSSSTPVTTLNLSRLAASEAATPRTSVILRTVITLKSFLLKMVWCSKPIDLWFQPYWEQSIQKIFKQAT